MSIEYWRECVAIALDDVGLFATKEQIDNIAGAVESGHDNYGMAHGHDCIPNPLKSELEETKTALRREREKRVCKECGGRGSVTYHGPCHSATSQCDKCRGEGKV